MSRYNSRKIIGFILISFVFLCIVPTSIKSDSPDEMRYVLAYMDYEDFLDPFPKIKVRYSNDGSVWNDGDFPSDDHLDLTTHGVGLMADDYGLLNFLMFDYEYSGENRGVKIVYGLGPAIWDKSDIDAPAKEPNSAPSGIQIGDRLYAITYTTDNNEVFVGIWDESTKSYWAGDYAPVSTLNQDVVGIPAIAILDDTVLLAWSKFTGLQFDLITSTGSFDGSHLTFTTPSVVSMPTDEYVDGCYSAPSVCNDTSKFYISVVRKEDGQSSYDVALLESQDSGSTWTNHRIIISELTPGSHVNIACGDGKLLAAYIREEASSVTSVIGAKLFDPGSGWTSVDINKNTLFGSSNAYNLQFSLISTRKPPPISFPTGWIMSISSVLLIGLVLTLRRKIKNRK
ncbi:MAG: hypothetical protein FK733_10280 [Asgard group archaeon]|nr:hypothetical protein [Asgard group archaeon]